MASVKGKDNYEKMPQIDGVDIVPSGGTAGQALIKDTGSDYDYTWQDITPSGTAVTSTATITDNRIARGDGGVRGIQESAWSIADNGKMTSSIDISSDYILDVHNTNVTSGNGFRIKAGEALGDIAFHIADNDDTFQIMEMEADQGYVTMGKTYAQTLTDNGVVYGLDIQHTGNAKDFNTQTGTYRIGGVDVIVPSGGTSGQILAKASGTSYDMEWIDGGGGASGDLPAVAARRTTQFSFQQTEVAVPFDTTDIENDTAVVEHTSTTEITVKETGLYLIHINLILDNTNSGKIVTVRVLRNGTTPIPECTFTDQPETKLKNATPARLVSLTANDVIDVRVVIDGNTGYVESGSTFGISRFTGLEGPAGADGAPGSGSTLIVKEEGTNVANTPHSAFNFIGDKVTVTDGGAGVANVTVEGGGFGSFVETTIAQTSGSTTINLSNTPTSTSGAQIVSANITPAAASNKVMVTFNYMCDVASDVGFTTLVIRDSTIVGLISGQFTVKRAKGGAVVGTFIDSPNTTSEVTYSLRVGSETGNWYIGQRMDGKDYNNTADDYSKFTLTEMIF